MGSWETEQDVAATRDERRGLVDSETDMNIFDGAQENGAECLGTPQQKEPTVKFFPRSSNFNGSSDRRGQGFEPMEQDHQEKGS